MVLQERLVRRLRFPVEAGPARFRGSSRAAAGGPRLEGSCLALWEIPSRHHHEAARAGEERAVLVLVLFLLIRARNVPYVGSTRWA